MKKSLSGKKIIFEIIIVSTSSSRRNDFSHVVFQKITSEGPFHIFDYILESSIIKDNIKDGKHLKSYLDFLQHRGWQIPEKKLGSFPNINDSKNLIRNSGF